MTTRELFAKHNIRLKWGRHKIVLYIGRDEAKIVASPEGFRWLRRMVEHGQWVDPLAEAEISDEKYRNHRRVRGAPEPEPEQEPEQELAPTVRWTTTESGWQPQYTE